MHLKYRGWWFKGLIKYCNYCDYSLIICTSPLGHLISIATCVTQPQQRYLCSRMLCCSWKVAHVLASLVGLRFSPVAVKCYQQHFSPVSTPQLLPFFLVVWEEVKVCFPRTFRSSVSGTPRRKEECATRACSLGRMLQSEYKCRNEGQKIFYFSLEAEEDWL